MTRIATTFSMTLALSASTINSDKVLPENSMK